MELVLFACVHNAGRSQMAAAFFNEIADPQKARAVSAGTQPAAEVHPQVIAAMREVDHDLAAAVPQRLTEDLAAVADLLVTLGCGEECPFVPGLRVEDWPVPDPQGKALATVRLIRDALQKQVLELCDREGWARPTDSVDLTPVV